MQKISVLLLLLLFIAVPATASYDKAFLPTDTVVINQSFVQDPTNGQSVPWTLWVAAGIAGLCLMVLSLVRSKTQKMDYEINIVISVLAWPFIWYWTWGGLTSIDYVVGNGITSSCNDVTIMITQHILYSFWLLGWIGIAGSIFAVFVTVLLVSQYTLFKDNEAEAVAQQRQRGMTDDKEQ